MCVFFYYPWLGLSVFVTPLCEVCGAQGSVVFASLGLMDYLNPPVRLGAVGGVGALGAVVALSALSAPGGVGALGAVGAVGGVGAMG
jgi:hypothetical protein